MENFEKVGFSFRPTYIRTRSRRLFIYTVLQWLHYSNAVTVSRGGGRSQEFVSERDKTEGVGDGSLTAELPEAEDANNNCNNVLTKIP